VEHKRLNRLLVGALSKIAELDTDPTRTAGSRARGRVVSCRSGKRARNEAVTNGERGDAACDVGLQPQVGDCASVEKRDCALW
jgi:hypothetical protein